MTLAKRAKEKGNAHASEFLPTLELWMRHLETVLAKGGTSPSDFTLHDADHALRVAERMEQLLTDSIRRNLSDYELALLLLAAYGHDIGMTPERGKVTAHHRHLFDPGGSSLDPAEKAAFQAYLDEHDGPALTLPLTAPADLNLADELVAFYVRERHNDWSAEWLRENLGGSPFAFLPDVVEILVRLCTSHHLDVRQLGSSAFDPFLSTGPAPQLIHLRYLACLLRLADILENDPERTPAVLLRHRALADRPRSLVHWQKDHALTIDILGDRLHFQARPRTAVAHRALLDLKDWIDHELHGIASFGERLPAAKTVGKQVIRRDWHLAPAVTHDIRPAGDAYEYIDGAFRPDTARLLQLLSGEQLYGNPFHAVRELLQNAFDAVREKIARKRLALPDPADRKWEEELGNQEHVTLTLRPGPHGGWQLVCEDSGVGLTRDIINRHVLVSGTGRRHAIRQLERDCEAAGFRPGLTGQFGIGVLSYFMLAEEVTLETTRYQGCGDATESWHFTTRGVGSFGELRSISPPFPNGGTRVIWGLGKGKVEDPDTPGYIGTFGLDLLYYLKETLVRIPCRFTFRREGDGESVNEWSRPPGWIRTKEDCLAEIKNHWSEPGELSVWRSPLDYDSEDSKAAILRYSSDLATARATLDGAFLEVRLPGDQGWVRLFLAYFDLPDGRALELPDSPPYLAPGIRFPQRLAWKGIRVDVEQWTCDQIGEGWDDGGYTRKTVSMDIDILGSKEAVLSVARGDIDIPECTLRAWNRLIAEQRVPWVKGLLAAGKGNAHHESNMEALEMVPPLIDAPEADG